VFSLFFIRRPIVAKVIALFIIIVGLIAVNLLPIAQFPQIVPPTVQVKATYTGGSASVVEEALTIPIEEQLNGVEGMIYMDSISASDGSSNIKVYFEQGYDINMAAVDVQNRVSLALPSLPDVVKQTGVSTKKVSSSMVQVLTISSSDPNHDSLFLSNFANLNIMEEIKRIEGVGDVQNMGERKYAMRIWIDPHRLSNLNLTINDINHAIKSQNLQIALGKVGDTNLASQNGFQYSLVAKSRLNSVEEFEKIVVRENSDGSRVYLKDIARVELGAETYIWSASLNNQNAALLGIYQLPNANALEVAQKVAQKIDELKSRFPKSIQVAPTYDTTIFVKISIQEVVKTLIEALLLVLLVVYLFLQSFRATIIPAIAIPVSLIGTFAILLAVGFSINTLTLFGLILAIGIVVDDAILVVENVEANLDKNPNLTLKEATSSAMKEIFTPIISTTLVLLAVFVPVTFIPGISGALYQQFAMTIAFAVVISSITALTLSPALAGTILTRKKATKKGWFFRHFNQGLERLKAGYEKLLRTLIRFWYLIIILYILLLGATYFVFKTLPTGFLPNEDQGTLIGSITLEAGSNLARTEQATYEAVELIKEVEGIKDVILVNGFNLITTALDSSTATLFIVLEDWSMRQAPHLSVDAIINHIQTQTKEKIPNATVRLFSPPSIPGLSAVGGFEFKLQNLNALPVAEFEAESKAFIQKLNQDPRIMQAYTMFNANYPQLYVDINRDKVSSLGININDLFTVLRTYLGSYYVNDFNKFGKTYRVFLQADDAFRTNKGDISQFFVNNAQGDMIPLSTVVRINNISGFNTMTHFNGYQSIAVNGMHNIKGGYSSADAITAIEELAKAHLPSSIGYSYSGITLQEKEAGDMALYIFILSLLMVFLFLSAQYESWLTPLIIMLPIPVVMFGALGANMIAGLLNDTYTQIGLVLLIGMSTKNAILIVEFAKELQSSGVSIVESAVRASILRLRAILMTVFSFILGILPLLFASGAGAASRQSLGTAVFGGMLLSTLLTFLLTPILFIVLERLKAKLFSKEA
jgi:HAE1 family hydrophobic/amphiphilic exporter-1